MITFRLLRGWVLLLAIAAAVGCSGDMPFDMVPIQGKVSYDDGSLIEAGSVTVTFNPIDVPSIDKKTAPGGQGTVNMDSGELQNIMTRRPGDGILVGRHKVVVASYRPRADGRPMPSNDVPRIYQKLATTPLEIDVKPEKGQFFDIKLSRN